MQEYWEAYMKPMEGHPSAVMFNVDVSDGSLNDEYGYVGFVKVFLHAPKDDGLLGEEEQEDISFIEDSIEMESLRYRIGKYVGRIITQGSVNFIYYLKYDFEWDSAVNDAMRKFEDYRYEFGARTDMEWEVYNKLLLPTAKQWQIIQNHRTCNMLQEAGDNLRLGRAIEHKIYFNTPQDREIYKEFIKSDGFTIQKEMEPSDEVSMYGLQFYRIDVPYYYEIDELTMNLIDNAKSYGGEYDGWETSVVKA
ncbi:DUF695 domain-containing protein [Sulfurimonas sp. HSL3-2]|uniref:DUF695 domain-containing protein n=1 Tax=Hydrocurvibacter mobilis TaxID=3131936 RepID=UPI0031F76DFF